MKLHSLFFNIFLFVFVLIFLIFPPLLPLFTGINSANDFSNWNFPFQQLCYFIFALGIYFINNDIKAAQKIENNFPSRKIYFFFRIFTPFFFTFLFLFLNSLIFAYISSFSFFENQNSITVEIPKNFISWFYCVLNFLFSAFYEEVIYRFYFCEKLNLLFNKKNKKILIFLFEFLGTVLFALGHFYLGILSVFNAAIAHLILRLCFKKSGNIYCGFAAHFIYNMISLILL